MPGEDFPTDSKRMDNKTRPRGWGVGGWQRLQHPPPLWYKLVLYFLNLLHLHGWSSFLHLKPAVGCAFIFWSFIQTAVKDKQPIGCKGQKRTTPISVTFSPGRTTQRGTENWIILIHISWQWLHCPVYLSCFGNIVASHGLTSTKREPLTELWPTVQSLNPFE